MEKYICKVCKCRLDPGENFICDECKLESANKKIEKHRLGNLIYESPGGQYEFINRRRQA